MCLPILRWGRNPGSSSNKNEICDTVADMFCYYITVPTPVFLPGESQGRGRLAGFRLWGRTESDTTEAT